MFRSLFVILAALALTASASSSSSSAFPSKLSSSSSYAPSNSSTGSVWYAATSSSSSSSSSGFPAGTYSISFEVNFAYPITTANINATAQSVQADIAYNIATLSGANNNTVAQSVFVTSLNGTRVPGVGSSRRLLQATSYPGGVTFILLGSIVNAIPSFNPTTAVTQFVQAAANGALQTVFTNATIPAQTIQAAAVGAVSSSSSSSSSTGYGDNNGVSSAASASVALLFAAVASLALLL